MLSGYHNISEVSSGIQQESPYKENGDKKGNRLGRASALTMDYDNQYGRDRKILRTE